MDDRESRLPSPKVLASVSFKHTRGWELRIMARGKNTVAPLREAAIAKERWVNDEAELDSAGGEEEEEEGLEDSEYEGHDEDGDARRHGDQESNSEPEEEDEEDMLRKSMADVPFEELLQARADGWTTGSQFRKRDRTAGSEDAARGGIDGNAEGERKSEGRTTVEKQQRANKNRLVQGFKTEAQAEAKPYTLRPVL